MSVKQIKEQPSSDDEQPIVVRNPSAAPVHYHQFVVTKADDLGPLVARAPTSEQLGALAPWQLLSRLQDLRFKRFEWLVHNRNQLLQGWQVYCQEYYDWRQDVERQIATQRALGHYENVRKLVDEVLQDPNARDPGEFKLNMITGQNFETITFQSVPLDALTVMTQRPEEQSQSEQQLREVGQLASRQSPGPQTDVFSLARARPQTGAATPRVTKKWIYRTEQQRLADKYKTSRYRDWTLAQAREEYVARGIYLKLRMNRKSLIYGLLRHDVKEGLLDLEN